MALTLEDKAAIVERMQKRFNLEEGNTGAPEVQVALLTDRISYLTDHMKQHKHDYATRRGLLKLVGQRRRLLDYLTKKDVVRYRELIAELGLRK